MAKLFFKYGTMGSSKTAQAIMCHYRYQEACKGTNKKVIFCKSSIDKRDGERVSASRIGLKIENIPFVSEVLQYSEKELKNTMAIIVDEAQFASKQQIDKLSDICDDMDIPVICYGLKTDFLGNFFPGSERLLQIADKCEEIKHVCACGKKALFNARVDKDGNIVKKGSQIELGGDERYVALCRKCYKLGTI